MFNDKMFPDILIIYFLLHFKLIQIILFIQHLSIFTRVSYQSFFFALLQVSIRFIRTVKPICMITLCVSKYCDIILSIYFLYD